MPKNYTGGGSPQKRRPAKKQGRWQRLTPKYKAIVISAAAVVVIAILAVIDPFNLFGSSVAYKINVQAVDKTQTAFKNSAKEGYSISLDAGEEILIKANIEPINAKSEEKVITFKSSDSSVFTASEGTKPDDESSSDAEKRYAYILVKGVASGDASLVLSNEKAGDLDIKVNVSGEVKSTEDEPKTTGEKLCEKMKLKLDLGDAVSLFVGKTAQMNVEYDPEDTTDTEVVWSSSDDEIAKINTKGKIEAIAEGKCIITASLERSDIQAEYELEVMPLIEVEKIELDTYEVSIKIGESKMPMVTMLPEDCINKDEVWESSNIDIATVEKNGNITGQAAGECEITVKAAANEEIKAVCKVKVTEDKPANTITEPTYINGILIVNKTYGLPADYAPGVDGTANSAFAMMKSAAAEDDLTLTISSGYRSFATQEGLYNKYVARDGKETAERYSARPGYSEHQTGLAFDVNNASSAFNDTPEQLWLDANCYKYGFIIRYPEGKESITGYRYESWHIRYVGVDLATTLYNSGKTLEEYLGVTSKYAE